MQPTRRIVRGEPHGLSNIRPVRDILHLSHASKNALGEWRVGLRNESCHTCAAILREASIRTVAGLDEFHANTELRKLMRKRRSETLDRGLARGIHSNQRH